MKKRIFSLVIAFLMVFACSFSAFAADENAFATEGEIMPTATDWIIGGPFAEYTSTSPKTGTFTYGISPAKMKIRVDLDVDAPVTMGLRIYDSSGNSLGVASFTATKAGSVTWNVSNFSLGPGTYKWEVFFTKAGVYAIYQIVGVTAT